MVPIAAMSDARRLIDRVEGMPWPKHAQLGPSDKGRANKELVVYWMLLNLKEIILFFYSFIRWLKNFG